MPASTKMKKMQMRLRIRRTRKGSTSSRCSASNKFLCKSRTYSVSARLGTSLTRLSTSNVVLSSLRTSSLEFLRSLSTPRPVIRWRWERRIKQMTQLWRRNTTLYYPSSRNVVSTMDSHLRKKLQFKLRMKLFVPSRNVYWQERQLFSADLIKNRKTSNRPM